MTDVELSLAEMALKEVEESPVAPSVPADASGFFDVMYNGCYGGFSTSQRFFEEYNRRMQAIDPLFNDKGFQPRYYFKSNRDDPVAVQLLKDLGWKASCGKYAALRVCRVPVRYKGFYEIDEYDGFESVDIKFNEYRIARIKGITANTSMSMDERFQEIIGVTDEAELEIYHGNSILEVGPLVDVIPM